MGEEVDYYLKDFKRIMSFGFNPETKLCYAYFDRRKTLHALDACLDAAKLLRKRVFTLGEVNNAKKICLNCLNVIKLEDNSEFSIFLQAGIRLTNEYQAYSERPQTLEETFKLGQSVLNLLSAGYLLSKSPLLSEWKEDLETLHPKNGLIKHLQNRIQPLLEAQTATNTRWVLLSAAQLGPATNIDPETMMQRNGFFFLMDTLYKLDDNSKTTVFRQDGRGHYKVGEYLIPQGLMPMIENSVYVYPGYATFEKLPDPGIIEMALSLHKDNRGEKEGPNSTLEKAVETAKLL